MLKNSRNTILAGYSKLDRKKKQEKSKKMKVTTITLFNYI